MDTCWAIIHLAVMNQTLTNQDHPRAWEYLDRILLLSLRAFFQTDISAGMFFLSVLWLSNYNNTLGPVPINDHCLDYSTENGLIGLLTLGHIISLSHLLDPRRNLAKGFLDGVNAERLYLESEFFQFQRSFSIMFTLEMDGQNTHPKAGLFDPLLLQLLVTIIKYKKRMGNTFDNRISIQSLLHGFQNYLQQHCPQLCSLFLSELAKGYKDIPYLGQFKWLKPFKIVYTGYGTCDTAVMQGLSLLFGHLFIILLLK